jgi:hypothetical protein
MKRTILTILLASSFSLAFGQKFQDVSAEGAPVSLSIKKDATDPDLHIVAHNKSLKGCPRALLASGDATDGNTGCWEGRYGAHLTVLGKGRALSRPGRHCLPLADA